MKEVLIVLAIACSGTFAAHLFGWSKAVIENEIQTREDLRMTGAGIIVGYGDRGNYESR